MSLVTQCLDLLTKLDRNKYVYWFACNSNREECEISVKQFDKLFGYGRCVINSRINLIDPLSLAELAEINEKLSVMTTEA